MPTVGKILLEKGSDIIATLENTSIREAVKKMSDANVGCLLVEYNEKIIGIFTERDLMRRVINEGKDIDKTTVEEVMTSPVVSCGPEDDTADLVDKLCDRSFRHIVVMDNDQAVGVVSIRDIAKAVRKRVR